MKKGSSVRLNNYKVAIIVGLVASLMARECKYLNPEQKICSRTGKACSPLKCSEINKDLVYVIARRVCIEQLKRKAGKEGSG